MVGPSGSENQKHREPGLAGALQGRNNKVTGSGGRLGLLRKAVQGVFSPWVLGPAWSEVLERAGKPALKDWGDGWFGEFGLQIAPAESLSLPGGRVPGQPLGTLVL